jgi:vitamin K-dependent gamma-carboxylase
MSTARRTARTARAPSSRPPKPAKAARSNRPAEAPAGSTGFLDILPQRLFEPVDVASLAFFRICFGLVMLWHFLEYLWGRALQDLYLTPILFFKFPGFEWVRPGSPGTTRALFWGLVALSVLIAAGLFYRAACALFCLGFTYVLLLDKADYQNHLYLISLLALLLTFIPAHRAFSLDAVRRPSMRSEVVPAWGLWLLRFQIAIPYFYGGLNKLNSDWLLRAQPLQIWLDDRVGQIPSFLRETWAAYALSWGGMLLDLLVVPALLWRRTRVPAFLAALFFHLTNTQIFRIGIFPWLMIAATLLFFPPDWPRRVKLLGGARRAPAVRSREAIQSLFTPRRSVLAVLGIYAAIQVLVPFRHLLYPGPVDWTEEGHQFSWRMKLRDKRGEVRFVAVDQAAGRVYPLDELGAAIATHQEHIMRHDPEMMRQAAVFLKERLRQAGYPDLQVRAVTSLSLNGRPRQPIIDPEVDLASARSAGLFGTADWIVPLKE